MRTDQPVHRRVDRRRRTTAAVQAEIERGDHLVLVLDAAVDADHRPQPVEPQHREALLGQRAEVAAGPLDPQQLHRLPVTGSMSSPLAEVLPPA